ncbi:MAG: restriction endonuclease subunit S [Planctomycetes bacterium]|nr:restriction endonuclease subunit S [Planctomycetota bacterium]
MVTKAEIPEGYKQTEVGVIPKDWETDKIRNLTSITTGAKNTQDKVDDGDYPFFVRSSIIERINSYSFDGEAVLTAGDGVGTGKIYHYINGKFDFHQRVYKISDFSEKLNGYYFYLFFSNNFYSRIMSMTAKSSVDSVRREMIADMLISFPPKKAEQEAIAEMLSDTDALIESLEKLIAKRRNIKRGAMQQLLTGKKRLPGFGVVNGKSVGYKQTEIGMIPKDWDVVMLGDCLAKNPEYGINAPAVPFSDNLSVYIRITDISDDGRFLPEKKTSVDHARANKYLLELGDVVLARTGASTGKSYLYNPKDGELVFAGFLIRCKTKENKLYSQYLKQFLGTHIYWNWVRVMSMRSGQPGINGNEYAQLPLPLPPTKAEQTAITQVLSDMDAEIESLEQKRDKYKAIKQGMMQKLLTGRIRLV